MAAEVPVCDVLCEAMEYLSKLGSNLRTRSENLREKKIRKDKLKNTHAVQKAANKVLLICELSKKSLENVETGVRKVLSVVDAAQASTRVGGKSSSTQPEKRADFHYFKYKSQKLRIQKRVPLKHYTSVKVLARKMPISMQDDYPVYYDCRLYRLRNRKDRTHYDTKSSSSERDSMPLKGVSSDNKNERSISTCVQQKQNTDDTVECLPDMNESVSRNIKKTSNSDNEVNSAKECPTDYNKTEKFDSENITSTEHLPGKLKESETTGSKKHSRYSESSKSQKDENKKKLKHVRVIESSESDEEKQQEEELKEKDEDIGDSSTTRNVPAEGESSSSLFENVSKKRKLNKSDQNVQSNDKQQVEKNVNVNENSDQKQESEDLPNKPMIKCVNINKLLKPDVLLNDRTCATDKGGKPSAIIIEKSTDRTKNEKSEQRQQEDDYWTQKRKEVKAFKSKSFYVNVTRLPKLSVNYLHIHNLKKITHNESVICQKINDFEKQSCDSSNTKTKTNTSKTHSGNRDITCLLNNSDSDDNYTNLNKYLTIESKKVKDSLLNESDSDNQGKSADDLSRNSVQEDSTFIVKSKNKGNSDSEKDSDKKHSEPNIDCAITKEAEKVKDALLNESDSELQENFTDEPSQNSVSKYTKITNKPKGLKNKEESDNQNLSPVNNDSESNNLPHSTNEGETLFDSSENELNTGYNQNKIIDEIQKTLEKDTESNIETNNLVDETKHVKEALLNESDSDHQENVSKAILNYSKGLSDNTNESRVFKKDSRNRDIRVNDQSKDIDVDKDSNSHNSIENCDGAQKTIDAQSVANEITTEMCNKELSPSTNPENIKSSLLNDSSNDIPKTPLSQRKKRKISVTPQSKRKHIMESMHAKKMLLTYSSSSDTDDEQLRITLKDIKKALLKGLSDEEDDLKDLKKGHHCKNSDGANSSSSEDLIKQVKEYMTRELTPDSSQIKKKPNKTTKTESDLNNQAKSNMDDDSTSSSGKMVRSRATPGGSSSQNSDVQDTNDKDIMGLTNLKSLNKTRRRRDSTTTDKTESSNSKKSDNILKEPSLLGEELLQADSSSDVASLHDNEEEELPPVTLSGHNGDSIGQIGKEDLLGDSDSSVSNDSYTAEDNAENVTADDSDEKETNVKSRRRKPNAISSGSEAGSSRKKVQEAKMSDFEDSDDDISEPVKKNKRKKKGSESDASVGSSSNDESKKKRRRIKQVDDSDRSGSDTENEGKNKHGRKNIRKVMGKNQLEEATKKAAREEKERIARIAERQKLYNNVEFDESGKPDEVVLEKVVLDFDPETKEPLIEVDRGLVKKLKPHQANGIKFMWNACFESVKRIKKDKGSGCILAHCMGLGKTLQVVSLTHTLLTNSTLTGVNRVLVVCPLSTVLNWVNEFHMWLKHSENDFEVDVYELSRYKQNSERAFQLQQWFEGGGVCVLGYEMFRNLSADNVKKFKKKLLRNFQESLVDPGPDLVVCDEGHLLKNEKTSLSQSMNRVKTLRRIVLTGTPLQNNLKEYYCMVQFVKPNLLGKYNEYLNRFVNPITNGQYTDSTEHDIRVMKRRSHVLHKMLDGAVQRRDYGVLAPFLPPKHEYVLFITLSEVQIKLYQFYLDNYSRRPFQGKSSGFLFPDFQSLQRIWTHPLVLKYNSERYEIMQQKKREREEEDSEGSLEDFINDDSTAEETSTEEDTSDDSSELSDDSRKKSKKKKSSKKSKAKESKISTRRGTRANPVELEDEDHGLDDVVEVKNENPTEWWIKLVSEEELEDMRNSHKLVLLFDILRQCETIGDKLLVFSQSLYSLDLIEHFLGKVDEATQEGRIDEKLGGHVGSWSPGVDYFRLDGSTSCENRSIWCKNFNREDNPRARLFLISTRAGGLGINLVAANRVVIFDVSWNPSHDVQSIFRVYRFGQKKPCYVYRFLAMGTMEEKIYERQVTKQAISKRVIDEQQIDRHYAENDLAELYKFEPHPPAPRQLPPLPKDRLFAEMLREHEEQIYKYHEHDSLLENKEEETLSEEERKAAWEDFENEKTKPPPAPFPSPWTMHNGMVPSLLAQQQQQLAYAALAAMLRKDMPNINDNQIRDMLPLIYNSNPSLMQKMGEIYKYTQPGMLNPAMMNPLTSTAGGMGGTSGLQYEPPWHRQQQQQQQMRLQQLMQQQNQMGAKLYAGGLGSRDPVAMALQQQRAREIMFRGGAGAGAGAGDVTGAGAGAGAGRPRGRPPLQPRVPAAAPAASDVVNLDSD